jgi:hypothetical protein
MWLKHMTARDGLLLDINLGLTPLSTLLSPAVVVVAQTKYLTREQGVVVLVVTVHLYQEKHLVAAHLPKAYQHLIRVPRTP